MKKIYYNLCNNKNWKINKNKIINKIRFILSYWLIKFIKNDNIWYKLLSICVIINFYRKK